MSPHQGRDLPGAADGKGGFLQTDWKTVLAVGATDAATSFSALSRLCQIYWFPLYAYVRRRGLGPEDAQDVTQGFFEFLLGSEGLKTVHPSKGRFRSFLLVSIGHFLSNHSDRQRTLKRGGQISIISWDAADAETRYAGEAVHQLSPDVLFERVWARALVDRVMERLRAEYVRHRQESTFAALQRFLTRDCVEGDYEQVAFGLGMGQGAVRTALHRLRERFGRLLCMELSQTIADPSELREEISHIFSALGRE